MNRIPFEPGEKLFPYLRDSGGNAQDLSIQRQRRELEEWARTNGIIYPHWYIDEARSGWKQTNKREDLARMMDALRNGADVSGVVVWNYERFFRDVKNAQLYLAEIRAMGYAFHSVTDDVPNGPEGVIIEAVKIYQAEQYSNKISESVSSGLKNIFLTFGTLPGTPPVGFKRSEPMQIGTRRDGSPRLGSKWEPDPDKVDLIRTAYQMRARGDSFKSIQQATGLFTSTNSWTTFFSNQLYKGVMKYGGHVVENYCEPIVTPELWKQANIIGAVRARPGKTRHHPHALASHFLLSGIVHCQQCGAPMYGRVLVKTNRRNRLEYYRCSGKDRRGDCDAHDVPRQVLEHEVLRLIEDHILNLENLLVLQERIARYYIERTTENKKIKGKLNHRLSKARRQIQNITDAIADGARSKTLSNKLQGLEIEAAEIENRLNDIAHESAAPDYTPAKLSALADKIKSVLAGTDLQNKKNILRGLLSRVVVLRTPTELIGMLYYVPPQSACVWSGAPAEEQSIGMRIDLKQHHYTPVE